MASNSLLWTFVGMGLIVSVAHYFISYLRSPLKKLPGPFIAKFSNLWRLKNHYEQEHIETQLRLHGEHGNVVQIGPNVVSVADPSLVKTIYSTRGEFLKSEYYSVNDAMNPDGSIVDNLFGTRSKEYHSKSLRPIQKLYSLRSSLELEPIMNGTVQALCNELEHRFMQDGNEGATCDIGQWISFFTWDFLGDMTFSKRFGFMKTGTDVENIVESAEKVMRYFSVVGQVPTLDKLLAKNRYLPMKFPDFSFTAGFCVDRFAERMRNLEAMKKNNDFMNWFLKVQSENRNVTDHDVISFLIVNILAGADTTSIVLKAIFYHILKTPSVKAKLVAELHSASLTYPPNHASLESLPYLDACIKEGLRIHPIIGQILERVVPQTGLTIPFPSHTSTTSITLPPGTIVGMNPWVVHFREEVFGARPREFIPERWLQMKGEADEEYAGRMKAMKDADLSFGNGNRVCLGRPLALIELAKVTATLFGKYEITLQDPTQEWDLHKQWFVWPHNIRVKMSPY